MRFEIKKSEEILKIIHHEFIKGHFEIICSDPCINFLFYCLENCQMNFEIIEKTMALLFAISLKIDLNKSLKKHEIHLLDIEKNFPEIHERFFLLFLIDKLTNRMK